jgi:ubiquinol-cytochrome c reductase cytochrome c subunit
VTTVRRLQLLAVAGALALAGLASPFAVAGADRGGSAGTVAVDRGSGGGGGDDDQLAQGRELYETGCSSCHGVDGRGVEPRDGSAGGPSLVDAGEAGAFFQLSTGRMPAVSSDEQPQGREPAYSDEEIDALVAYVASLGDGPELPEVDPAAGDLAQGGEIFRANCQACHSASGSGGALSYGRAAPGLADSTPEQTAAAVRVGPGQMPTFDNEIINVGQLNDLVRYVDYLDDPADPGGLPIGRTGPIPEGFVAWLVGMVALIGLVVWIGTRSPIRSDPAPAPAADADDDPEPAAEPAAEDGDPSDPPVNRSGET